MKLTSAFAILAATIASASAQSAGATIGQDLCCATNQERAQAGLPALKWTPALDLSSQRHCDYQRSTGKMDHFEAAGSATYGLGGRLSLAGFEFSTAGENLGKKFNSVSGVTTAWMNSPGHKANIMGKAFTVCGGAVANPGGYYTINYASPMDSDDSSKYYTLQCSGPKSNGAFVGAAPVAHNAKPTSSAAPVVKPASTSYAAAKPTVVAKPVVVKPVATTPAAVNPVVVVKPTVTTPAVAKPVATTPAAVKPITSAPVVVKPAPVIVVVKPNPNTVIPVGKCKRVPKGSIAAGKCKPCKKCGTNSSPFRR
ncbi:hypothetical protein LPJ66_001701 [Kickxella alabastrina]|uniref:Uncharacterized protein n=1 Tax=Kickxella alabastrina TaxID=61397 RepID=A0ACC1ISI7_9FUNG|nr:hypothetical protein LPJ66_001701 [Kickxella alabastrina]